MGRPLAVMSHKQSLRASAYAGDPRPAAENTSLIGFDRTLVFRRALSRARERRSCAGVRVLSRAPVVGRPWRDGPRAIAARERVRGARRSTDDDRRDHELDRLRSNARAPTSILSFPRTTRSRSLLGWWSFERGRTRSVSTPGRGSTVAGTSHEQSLRASAYTGARRSTDENTMIGATERSCSDEHCRVPENNQIKITAAVVRAPA